MESHNIKTALPPKKTEMPVDVGQETLAIKVTSRWDWIAAGIISAVMFTIYFLTSSRWAFPGESSGLLAILTGARPNVMPENFFWQKILGGVTWLAGPRLAVEAATVICMLFSALSLGLMYLVTTAVFGILIDKKHMDKNSEARDFHADFASRLGGIVTTLILAFSAPFWVAASRVNLYSIYLLWMLVAAYLMLRFMASGNSGFLFVFCFLYGMGMSQSSVMIQFSPVFVLMAVMGMIRFGKYNYLTGSLGLVILGIGFAMMLLASVYSYTNSPGYVLQEYWGKSLVAEKLIRGLFIKVFNSLPRNGWLIIVGLVILPWLAWLIVAARTLNGENGPAIKGLNLAIFIVTLTVVLDTRVSPWQFFGFSAEQIVTYTMTSMTFGYCITSAYMYTVYLLSSKTESKLSLVTARGLRIVILSFAGIILIAEIGSSYVHAETKNTTFITTYVDRLIDNLDGRNWIVTDGVFDDMILLRGMERGMTLNMLDLGSAGNKVYTKQLKEKLTSARLKNSLDIGVFTFLQEWIASDSEVSKKLVLCLFPDLWSIGDFRIYPKGLAFFGGNETETGFSGKIAAKENVDSYFKLMDELDIQISGVSERSSRFVLALAASVRRRVSFIGNNLGYFIETRGQKREALDIYKRVHEFDPGNVSAMLNYASSLEQFGTEKEKENIKNHIAEFKKKQTKPLQIWELSRTQGYVNSPEAFSYLGWTWAMSGQSTLALKTLGMAIGNDYDSGVFGMMMTMADIHSRRGDTEQTEKILEAILKDNPNDLKSLLSLAQIKMIKGEIDAAGVLLEKARQTGIPKARILREEASLKLAMGDFDGARVALLELLADAPKDADARLSLYMTYAKEFSKSENDEQRNDIRPKMLSEIDNLLRIPDARYFQGAIARGHMNLLENKLEDAREDFLIANKTMPGIVPILELILRLDYSLKDPGQAKQHAMDILQIAPDHPFANYIMGSIALSHGEFESAEAYLQRSIERDASVIATGDLAYVKFKLDDVDRAFELVTQALDRSKDLYEVWDTYGQILFEQGKLEESEAALRTALKLNVQNPIVHLHLARVLFAQGRKQDSRNILEGIQPFESSLYGEEKRYYNALWLDVFGIDKMKAITD